MVFARRCRSRAGVTLIELVVAMAVITIGVLAAMASFRVIVQGLSASRETTIANNLAQEKMEVLKQLSYYQLMVTTAQATNGNYTPNLVYDTGNYPPEIITIWGLPAFTRTVEVDYAVTTGNLLSTAAYTSDDTGLKRIIVDVAWTERGVNKKVELSNLLENSQTSTLNSGFQGTVNRVGGGVVPGAKIRVIGYPQWQGKADSAGGYQFQVAAGSYSIVASSSGYYSSVSPFLMAANGSYVSYSFSLVPIATGTVASQSVFTPAQLVVSQVVASTVVPSGFDVQYIELLNNTTWALNIGNGVSHQLRLNFTSEFPSSGWACNDIALTYVSTWVAAGRYYLIANTPAFILGGANVTADAYYSNVDLSGQLISGCTSNPQRVPIQTHSGTISIAYSNYGTVDAVGWKNGATAPAGCSGSCIPLSGSNGLLRGDQIVRYSSACAVSSTYARAYKANDNSSDFFYNTSNSPIGVQYSAFTSAAAPQTIIGGRTAAGAFVSANDPNSTAILVGQGSVTGAVTGQSCPISSFTLVGVATGTWKVTALSSSYGQVVSNVAVTQNATTMIPNAATTPAWPAAGMNYLVVKSTYAGGYVQGYVYGAGSSYSSPINNMLVSASGVQVRTGANGFYQINTSTGTVTVTANPNYNNNQYISSAVDVSVAQGGVTTVADFHLANGGFIQGFVTSGVGALPGVVVQATGGGNVFSYTSDQTGYFYIVASTSSSPYTVAPVLDPLQAYTSVPSNPLTVTVSQAGATVFAGTFTVTGALGTISGTVSAGGNSITTGVLIVATTATIVSPPAAIVAATAPSQAPVYATSSKADGTYLLPVRASTSAAYNLRAWYPEVDVNSGAVTYRTQTLGSVNVSAGGTVPNKNFSW